MAIEMGTIKYVEQNRLDVLHVDGEITGKIPGNIRCTLDVKLLVLLLSVCSHFLFPGFDLIAIVLFVFFCCSIPFRLSEFLQGRQEFQHDGVTPRLVLLQ